MFWIKRFLLVGLLVLFSVSVAGADVKWSDDIVLCDGSTIHLKYVEDIADWAKGPRKTAAFQGTLVVLYYIGTDLQSIRIPSAGNQAMYTKEMCE